MSHVTVLWIHLAEVSVQSQPQDVRWNVHHGSRGILLRWLEMQLGLLRSDNSSASRVTQLELFQTRKKENDWLSLAVGIAQLRAEGIRLRNIAVLVRTNDEAKAIGTALQELKIPALLELPGLLSTREGALVLSGLRLVADRSDSLAAATLTEFIVYLERLADSQEDTRLPPLGIEAVTLVTYNKAKGREWPVVILAGLDFERDANLWSPEVTGGTTNKNAPLQDRTLCYWPWPFGRGQYNKLIEGSGAAQGDIFRQKREQRPPRDRE